MPMKQIAAKLGVSVGSVHLWTADIEISEEQRERNLARAGRLRGRRWRDRYRDRRLACQDDGREAARLADPVHEAGCMLYWAEGSKSRNRVTFCNSDEDMIRFFKDFLLDFFEVRPEEFQLSLHVYLGNGLTLEEIQSHWLRTLDLPRSVLRKAYVNPLPTSSSGRKANKLPYGVCTLTLGRTEILQHIYGAIQEYAGFEEPRWLDGPPRKPRTRGS